MNKKRVVAAVLLVALVIGLAAFWFYQRANRKLSDLDDQELLQYLTDAGVTIPEGYGIKAVREVVITFENDPDYPTPLLGWMEVGFLYDDLRQVVRAYEWGVDPVPLTEPERRMCQMDDEALLQYLLAAGARLPEPVDMEVVRHVVHRFEEKPTFYPPDYSPEQWSELYEDIRMGVVEYESEAADETDSKCKLSEMSELELMSHLRKADIIRPGPDMLVDMGVVRNAVILFENDPDYPEPAMGWSCWAAVYEDIGRIVNEFEGR